jgi:hypothetical protein
MPGQPGIISFEFSAPAESEGRRTVDPSPPSPGTAAQFYD